MELQQTTCRKIVFSSFLMVNVQCWSEKQQISEWPNIQPSTIGMAHNFNC